jgi:hypothetical protein
MEGRLVDILYSWPVLASAFVLGTALGLVGQQQHQVPSWLPLIIPGVVLSAPILVLAGGVHGITCGFMGMVYTAM